MIGDIVGFCIIRPNSTSGISADDIKNFERKPIRVMEFGMDGCVMVLNNEGTAIATFNKEDIISKFECTTSTACGTLVICPPNKEKQDSLLNLEKIAYVQKCLTRKGGYNQLLSNMVIAASLHKGQFNDSFLWQNQ